MGILSNMKVGIDVMPNSLSPRKISEALRDKKRFAEQPHRRWYFTKRWVKLRLEVLVRDRFTCQHCGWFGMHISKLLVANHKVPHKGDEKLFWDKNNLECSCKECHDGLIQSREKREANGVGGSKV